MFPSLGCTLKTKQEACLSLGSPSFPSAGDSVLCTCTAGARECRSSRHWGEPWVGLGEGFPSTRPFPPPRVALRWSTAVEMKTCVGCCCGSAISVYLQSVGSSCSGLKLGLSVPVALRWGHPPSQVVFAALVFSSLCPSGSEPTGGPHCPFHSVLTVAF